MSGEITPKSQPIDPFIANKFKGVMKEYYDDYLFYADENEAGHQIPPS